MGNGPGLGQPFGVCGGEQGWGDQKTGETAHFGTWEGDLGWSLLGNMASPFTTVGSHLRFSDTTPVSHTPFRVPHFSYAAPSGSVLVVSTGRYQ